MSVIIRYKESDIIKKINLQNNVTVFFLAMLCCLLWGSAFPCVKIGYRLFEINSDTFSQVLFAGCRFFLAGIMTIIIGSVLQKKLLKPKLKALPCILKLSVFQTILQYIFFYIGLAGSTGTKSSIITASNVFFTIFISAIIFRQEKFTTNKIIGCLIGFMGIILINIHEEFKWNFNLNGDGFIVLSAMSYAISSSLTKKYSKDYNPVMLSGWQFVIGGFVMSVMGFIFGGRFEVNIKGICILIYLGMLSAIAFSVWWILLKHNSVSKVSVYGFMNPVFGVVLSALLLKENMISISKAVISLILISVGIILVNKKIIVKKERT